MKNLLLSVFAVVAVVVADEAPPQAPPSPQQQQQPCVCPVTVEQVNAEKALLGECKTVLKTQQDHVASLTTKHEETKAKLTADLTTDCDRKLKESVSKEIASVTERAATAEKASSECKKEREDAAIKYTQDLEHQRVTFNALMSSTRLENSDARRRLSDTIEELETKVLELQRKSEAEKLEVENNRRKLQEDRTALESRIEQIESEIFSSYQFWLKYNQCKKIGSGFIQVFRRRLANVCGGIDPIEIISLQTKLWWNKLIINNQHIQTIWTDRVLPNYNTAINAIQNSDVYHGALNTIDERTQKTVRSLAAVDPDIAKLIPQDFSNRCYAFAFIFIVLGTTLNYIINYTWSIIKFPFTAFSTKGNKKQSTKNKKKISAAAAAATGATTTKTSSITNASKNQAQQPATSKKISTTVKTVNANDDVTRGQLRTAV